MIDIYSKVEYPSNALSNFAAYDFEVDGVKCASMEGFLQSLKFRSVKKQHEICLLVGKEAKLSAGRLRTFIWKFTQTLYWNGRKYKRSSPAYQELITKAYDCLWENEKFRNALLSTGNESLSHKIGGHDIRKTVLTEHEFIGQLNRLRVKGRAMKISVFGDSISTFYGFIPENHRLYYDVNNAMRNGLSGVEDTWWHQVIEAMNGELLVNASYSGSKVSGTEYPAANTYERVKFLANESDPDCILVYLGFNDYGFGMPVTSVNGELTSLYPAYRKMLETLRVRFPFARIICGTIMQTYITYSEEWVFPEINNSGYAFSDYNNAIRNACAEFSIEVADLAKIGRKYDTLDGSHPTDKGHRELADAWKEALGMF